MKIKTLFKIIFFPILSFLVFIILGVEGEELFGFESYLREDKLLYIYIFILLVFSILFSYFVIFQKGSGNFIFSFLMIIVSIGMWIYLIHGFFWGTLFNDIIHSNIVQFFLSIEFWSLRGLSYSFFDEDGSSFLGLIGTIFFIIGNLIALYALGLFLILFLGAFSLPLIWINPKIFNKLLNWYTLSRNNDD